MTLRIQIKKRYNEVSILNCLRTDGTSTHAKLHQGLEIHDIAHFVVEQELRFTQAFYGLIEQGYDIGDFQLPKAERPLRLQPRNLHPEALITEHLVNLLQIDYLNPTTDNFDFMTTLATVLKEHGLPFPEELNQARLDKIRLGLKARMLEWKAVAFGSALDLSLQW